MREDSNSDDELLALLQPIRMPADEIDYVSNMTLNDAMVVDEAPIPDLVPTAPMASTDEQVAPQAPVAAMQIVEPAMEIVEPSAQNEQDSVPPQPRNCHADRVASPPAEAAQSSQVEEADSDEIAYEPLKTPSRAARFSNKRTSASRPSSRRKPTTASSKLRTKPPKFPAEPEAETSSQQDVMAKVEEREPEPEAKSEPPKPKMPPTLDFDIVIDPLPLNVRQEYKPIPPGDEIYRVLQRIPTGIPGETWLSVEFEDGHIDQVSSCL